MQPDQWRLTVKLKSHRALMEFMEFKGHKSAYSLARAAGINVGIVGHLVGRRRNSCSYKSARAIEEALGCPSGFLFEAKMSQVADTMRLRERQSA